MPLLSLAIWLPILSGVALLAFGTDARANAVRWSALVASLVSFAVTVPLITGFNTTTATLQFVEKHVWIERVASNYLLGVDGLSVWFVLLTAFITVIVVVSAWQVITERVNQVPRGVPGALRPPGRRVLGDGRPAVLRLLRGDIDPDVSHHRRLGRPASGLCSVQVLSLHAGRLLADVDRDHLLVLQIGRQLRDPGLGTDCRFRSMRRRCSSSPSSSPSPSRCRCGRSTPGCPMRTSRRRPAGSVVLAAIMLKLGAYGFLRFSLPIAPDASRHDAWLMIALSLVAVVYIGLVALVQQDMKKLVAYSSIAHMGFVTLRLLPFRRGRATAARSRPRVPSCR